MTLAQVSVAILWVRGQTLEAQKALPESVSSFPVFSGISTAAVNADQWEKDLNDLLEDTLSIFP
jgi:hypothetical protein